MANISNHLIYIFNLLKAGYFVEAEGSFHIIERRDRGTLEHGFNVTQKRSYLRSCQMYVKY